MATHTATTGAGGPSADLPGTVIEELLASPDRRALLRCLAEADEPIPVDDLAAVLADGTTGATASERRRARTAIYQDHLPKLTATGVVEFDSILGTLAFSGPESIADRLASSES